MQAKILLNYSDNTKTVEEEEKNRFLRSLLNEMGLIIDFWNEEDLILTVDQKIKLRKLLLNNNLQVIDDSDGSMKIFFENTLIGSWDKPTYKLKKDMSQLDHRKQLYVEMSISCQHIFDENNGGEK